MKITKIACYVRDISEVVEFYEKHFGFTAKYNAKRDKAVLSPASGGCSLVLLRAAKSQKIGQVLVKIIFDVPDVAAAKAAFIQQGLRFGAIHQGPNYQFSNARDPAKNTISISDGYLVNE